MEEIPGSAAPEATDRGAGAPGSLPIVLLPVSALRLVARFFVPLTLWFSAGAIVRHLLIQSISRLGHGGHPAVRTTLVLLPLSLVVLAALVVTIGMLFTLGRGLAVIGDADEPYVAAIGRTLFPFVLVYLGWGLYTADIREVLRADAQRLGDAGNALAAGTVLNDLPIVAAMVVAVGSWGLRVLCERRYEQHHGRSAGVLTAFFEVNFTLYALYSIFQLVRGAQGWITGRVFWQDSVGGLDLPDLGPARDALVLPLVWLAVASIVFGLEMRDREAVRGTPLERLSDRFNGRLDARPGRLAEVGSRGMRETYVPLLHASRLVFRAGGPAFAWFCLCYVATGTLLDRAQRGVIALLGTDHTVRFWNLALVPVEFVHSLLYEAVRLALLAAMFDLVSRRISGRTPASAHRSTDPDPAVSAAEPGSTG
jgi:hypothetical protein